MAETTEEFMVRFKATGLDMLCEARRRAEQSVPFYGTVTGRMSMMNPAFDWPYGLEANQRSTWKSRTFGARYFDPESFLGRDFTALEERVMQVHISTPEGPYRESFRRLFQPDPAYRLIQSDTHGIDRMVQIDPDEVERLYVTGRRMGQSFHKLSTALALAAATLSTFDGRHDMFHESDPEQNNLPERILWPGVKAQVEGERRLNPKRIAKDRMKKKLAKKSKR